MLAITTTCCGGQRDRFCASCGGSLLFRRGVATTVGALWAQDVHVRRGVWAPTLREAGRRTRLAASELPVEQWRWLAERCLDAATREWERLKR